MGIAGYIEQQVSALLDFGYALRSKVLDRSKSVLLRIRGDEDPDGDDHEEVDDCAIWGEAPLLYRPQDPTDAGAMEVLFTRWGDERVVIATKDLRFQVEPAVGEVRLVALGKDGSRQAQVVLKPSGDVSLEGVGVVVLGDSIKLGSPTAGDYVALASPTNGRLDRLSAALDAFCAATPGSSDGGAVLQTAVKAVWGTGSPPTPSADVAASKVMAE